MENGVTIWFTGLSGAGKSTIANRLVEELRGAGRRVELLDGDEVRTNLSSGLGFSKADRDANIRRIGFVAKLLARNGVVAITAAISPYRDIRDEIRNQIVEYADFLEVFVDCPLEECERRDVKGLYKKARAGEIKQFTGISDPYEPPLNPDVTVHTDRETLDESVGKIMDALRERGHLPTGEAYTEEEETLVSERLKSLGYL